eukprot:CAMPEP_0185494412 /NCGR_PEP_ID=MMETSP1366-20130426/16838_1 /TAXON_ID=38817 /ORGANISM="Gephyrocapsa oceanica, Strain RCC1303" /LENGTH=32 /DNA_ID= /DNA_START= /DNA_END= /DNA_ORIENTATION=
MTTAHQTARCAAPHRDPVLTGLAGAPIFFEGL